MSVFIEERLKGLMDLQLVLAWSVGVFVGI
jgi:hypothetical protein